MIFSHNSVILVSDTHTHTHTIKLSFPQAFKGKLMIICQNTKSEFSGGREEEFSLNHWIAK